MSVHAAATETVDALREMGRLEDVDSALVAAFLALAAEIDAGSDDKSRAALYRELRQYHTTLLNAGGADGDGLDALVRSLSSEVGYTPPPRPSDSR